MNTIRVRHLRCEYMKDPIGIEEDRPRLFWNIESEAIEVVQKSYQILAANTKEALKKRDSLIVDTGWIDSGESTFVDYPGNPVAPEQEIFWQVRIKDTKGNESDFSDIASFERSSISWEAEWIRSPCISDENALRPVPLLRRGFRVNKPIEKARLYCSARGVYIPHVNGQRLDEELFNPGCANYRERILYQTYDLTHLVCEGNNVLGAELGTGWYAGNYGFEGLFNIFGDTIALIMQLHIIYRDGEKQIISSGADWKTAKGPIEYSDIYQGEFYDARNEIDGWDLPDFDDSQWDYVDIVSLSKDVLAPHDGEPVKRIKEVTPKRILETPAGETVIDMGQNFVGWLKVRLVGSEGSVFSCDFAEVLDKTGNFYTENMRIVGMKDTYILKGKGIEVFEPSFTFHGFRYVRILEHPSRITVDDITGIAIHTDMEHSGMFSCSEPLLNQLQHNIEWGQRGNFLDIPTDCPQRDERLGWTGDAQVFIKTACFNFNVAPFFKKWLRDMASEQRHDGNIPVVIPNILKRQDPSPFGSAAWGDASIICPWTLYKTYGDKRFLEESYPMMKAWNEYVSSKTIGYIWKNDFHFGDWLALDQPPDSPSCFGGTDKEQVATAFYAYATSILARCSRVLGYDEEVKKYERQFEEIRDAYYREFVTRSGRVGSNTQTAYVHALHFGLLPEEERENAALRLIADIKQRGFHLSTGFTGTPYLLHVLSDNGYEDISYALLLQQEYPSWLYSVNMGATTIWERWDGIRPDGSFQTPEMNSFNHYAYGAVGDWMYPHIAGFSSEKGGKRTRFMFPENSPLSHATGSYDSLHGEISSTWHKNEDSASWEINIPHNTFGEVLCKYQCLTIVSCVEKSSGQRFELSENITTLGSGTYQIHLRSK